MMTISVIGYSGTNSHKKVITENILELIKHGVHFQIRNVFS